MREYSPILAHHWKNIFEDKTYTWPEDSPHAGKTSSVYTVINEYDGKQYLYPTVWDGKILRDSEAAKRAFSEGVFEEFDTVEQAKAYDKELHIKMKVLDQKEKHSVLKALGGITTAKPDATGVAPNRDSVLKKLSGGI